MASNAGIFFAGVGTTFIILGAGFGGGLMMATSALKEPVGYQKHTSDEPPPPARVILPSTAEAAQPPQPAHTATAPEPPLPPPLQPAKEVEPAVQKQVEKVDTKKAESEQRERRKRYAERKARRQAEKAKRQQQIERGEPQEAPILAFGGDEPRRSGGFGFFGN